MRLLKVGQVFVVSDHYLRVACPLEIVFPLGESMDHSEEFMVKNIIAVFCDRESFGEEGIRVQVC